MANSNFHVINLIIRKANDDKDLDQKKYEELFKEFAKSETSGKSSREKEALLVTNSEIPINQNENICFGQFVEYTNIDKKKWFNLLKKEIDPEFSIPEHLKANSVKNFYFFIPSIHRFCYSFTSKEKIDPLNVEAFLNEAFTKFLNKNYNKLYYPEINFEKERETIEEIINAKQLFSLEVTVSYSNDFSKDMKDFFEEDMKQSNADSIKINANNKNGESLDLSKGRILRGAIEASTSQGTATARIKNGKTSKTIKTIDHPAKYKVPSKAIPEYAKEIYNFFISLF